MNRTEFFDALNKGARWDVGVSIKRSNPLPLDDKSVFGTYAALEEYAAGVLAYPGQVVAVVEENKTTIYYLDGQCAIKPVGIIPTGDEKTVEVTAEGEISLKGAAEAKAGQQPRIVNKGTAEAPKLELEWFTPDNSTVEGLQGNVGALQEAVNGVVEEDGTVTKEGLTHKVASLEEKVGNAAEGETAATGLYKAIADEVKRAEDAEKALDDKIKEIDFIDEDELAEAIKDFAKTVDVNKTLEDYATKTYVDGEIDKVEEMIGNMNHFKTEIVDSVDKVTEVGVLYLIKDTSVSGVDKYNEYIVVGGEAVLIGDTTTDLSNYYNKTEVYNKTEIDNKIKDEQDARELLAERVAELEEIDNATQEELNNYKEEVTQAIATAKGEAIADTADKLKNYYTKEEVAGLNHATKTEVENAVAAEAEIARAAEKANADAIAAIKDHATVDSFADVVAELAKKQDNGDYATNDSVNSKIDSLKENEIKAAQDKANQGVADASAAQSTANEAKAKAETNALNLAEVTKTVNGDGSTDGLVQKVANHETRIGSLEGTINGVGDNKGLADKVADIEATLPNKADKSTLNGVTTRVETLETTVGDTNSGLVKKAADNASAIAALETRVKAEEDKVDNDTTYTFENGTEGTFKVTAKGGEAQTVNTGAKDYTDSAIENAIEDLDLDNTYAAKEHEHVAADITDLDTTIKAYDYATKTEAQGYANAKDSAIAEAKQAGDDAQAAADAIAKDYLKAADKTALQEQITANANAITLLTDGADPDKVDSVKDLIDYVDKHGTEVTGMKADIAKNTKAISDHEAAAEANYETKTDASGKLEAAKEYADGLNTAMNTRVEALEAIDHDHDNKTVLDGITADKVSAWDAAEQNAKDYVDEVAEDLVKYEDLQNNGWQNYVPVASLAGLGVVKSSEAVNKVKVAEDGTMEVNNINISKLIQDENQIFVLDGNIW